MDFKSNRFTHRTLLKNLKLVAFDYEEANGFFGSRAFVKDYLVPSKYELEYELECKPGYKFT